MSKFTDLRDKVEGLFVNLFKHEEPIAEQVLATTASDIVQAAMAGTIHGSADMVAVATKSLSTQLPTVRPAAIAAAAAVITDHVAENAEQPKNGGL